MTSPRVLVITLFSGENELEQCIESVAEQVGVQATHEVIRNLPKQLAHQKLYSIVNERASKYDYFAKLDADMMFSSADALKSILLRMGEGLDILSISVWDGMTNDYMQSFNVFSNKCVFDAGQNNPLFTDNVPVKFPGKRLYEIDVHRLVRHAFDPSPYQAFAFGVHRAMKVMQRGASVPLLENSFHQLVVIQKVWRNYQVNGDESARLALLGASMVVSGEIRDSVMGSKNDYCDDFSASVEASIDDQLKRACVVGPLHGLIRLWGWPKFFHAVSSYVRRKGVSRVLRVFLQGVRE